MSSTLDLLLGAPFVGTIVSGILYGIMCGQVLRYYSAYPDDRPLLKWMVAIVFAGDTMGQCLAGHAQWYYLINKCGHGLCLHNIWSDTGTAIPQQICSYISKAFFIMRIWRFRGNKAALALFVPAAIGLVSFFLYLRPVFKYPEFGLYSPDSPHYPAVQKLLMLSAASALLTDVGITIGMCYLLHVARKEGIPSSRSWSIMTVLITYTLATGLLAMICEALLIATFIALPRTFVFDAVFYILGQVDVNCMLAALNLREALRGRFNSTATVRFASS
ncbi:hypothetical protein NEOLEDRAFT_830323 [Neolentinus lepideus HHB14362 ss-1]|uniref:DUF6534 domain-containing protein n=1 Tax=Neolentinus lepideus HHB14362 ss-1 TaxID=1314782 RepID=A0A165P9B9_9AGAM|nr:hypothetical protein NEOLEDRAFT_830323 [Neolentinus lepideus HHB14362 ss-1]